jgi:hypothetical protein
MKKSEWKRAASAEGFFNTDRIVLQVRDHAKGFALRAVLMTDGDEYSHTRSFYVPKAETLQARIDSALGKFQDAEEWIHAGADVDWRAVAMDMRRRLEGK